MSKQIAAIYEGGMLRPLEPPDLAEGEEVDVVLLPRQKQGERSLAQILAEIAALPLEGQQDAFTGADHDSVLYGENEP